MDKLVTLFTDHWQQKTVAFIIALMLWLFVWASLTDSKTIPNVPVRIVNLPEDKTIVGMMPNGILHKRITLTLKGSKGVIDELEPGDIEVLVDASTFEQDEQVLKVTRKNLVSLNPNINVSKNIEEVTHSEFILKLSNLITKKIPIRITPPKGEVPQGYVYLDIWPQKLVQVMTGPEEQLDALANRGIDLQLDFSQISKSELDRIKSSRENYHDDEVSFFIPNSLKKIPVPFLNHTLEEINDPEAQNLHIDFLRKELIPLERELPLRMFYPLATSSTLNPKTLPLNSSIAVKIKNELTYLPMEFYVWGVSRLFVEVVRDNLLISVVATKDTKELPWGVSVIAPHELENKYVAHLISKHVEGKSTEPRHSRKREAHLRARFHDFLQRLTLYTASDKKFDMIAKVENNEVILQTQQISVDAAR